MARPSVARTCRAAAGGPRRGGAACSSRKRTGSSSNSRESSRSSRRSARPWCATRRSFSADGSAEFQSRHQKQTEEADKTFPARLDQIRVSRDEGLKKAEEHFPPRIAALKEKYEKDRRELDESNRKTKETTKFHYEQAWSNLIKNWTEGMARVDQTVREVREEAERRFLEWSRPELDGWKPPIEVPPGMRFGAFDVDLSHFPNGMPVDPRLKSVPTHFQLPALLPFPIQGSVLIKAADAGQGRGDHAAAIADAALPDLDSARARCVSRSSIRSAWARISRPSCTWATITSCWSRTGSGPRRQHIEQRLTDLTEHMENVIQKYLRNEFETIEEYNTMAGEVAEPFRILVVANFPTNFNDAALRRLDQHRQQRCAVRRVCPGHARHQARAAVGLPAQGARKPVRAT